MSALANRDVIRDVTDSDQFKRHTVLRGLIEAHDSLFKLVSEMSDWDRDEIGGCLLYACDVVQEQVTYLAGKLQIEVTQPMSRDVCGSCGAAE